MLGGGGGAEFVICARVRIIGFLQPMVIRWLPYLVNLSPGMINLITGGQAGQGKDRAGERWGGKKQVSIRRAKTAALPLLRSQKKGGDWGTFYPEEIILNFPNYLKSGEILFCSIDKSRYLGLAKTGKVSLQLVSSSIINTPLKKENYSPSSFFWTN